MIAAWPATGSRLALAETVAEALANLYAQRQRSALALLGILIGTASIVAMLTIGHMAQRETLKLFRHLGVDMLQIHAMPAGNYSVGELDRRAIERLPASDPDVIAAAPLAADHDTVLSGERHAELGIAAVTPDLPRLMRIGVVQGRFIAPIDDGNLVAVVGAGTVEKLSAPGAPLGPGSAIRVKGYVFEVVGVLGPVPFTALDPTDVNNAVLIPLADAGRVMDSDKPTTALIHLEPAADVKGAGARIAASLANPTADLQVFNARDLIRSMNAQKAIHSQLLTAVGAISLLVGGIGVMNVMLMGVMERRREIGLRAAVGATPRDIQLMFLIEAATLAFVGGVAGLAAGLMAALVTARASGWTFSLALWVLPLGPGVAALVGVAFGLYPAIKASRLSPIDALRAD